MSLMHVSFVLNRLTSAEVARFLADAFKGAQQISGVDRDDEPDAAKIRRLRTL